MTPARLLDCLERIGWTAGRLARMLGRSEGNVRQWLRGEVPVPAEVADWLEALARCHDTHLPPKLPRRVAPRA